MTRRRWPLRIARGLMVPLVWAGLTAETFAASATLFEWLSGQHQVIQRYRTILLQIVHDYQYDYLKPPLLVPGAIDLYGYIVRIHELELVMYPVIRKRLSAEQQLQLALIEQTMRKEVAAAGAWRQAQRAYEGGSIRAKQLAEVIEQLRLFVNRHIVLQAERVMLVLDGLLTPEEQTSVLRGVAWVGQQLSDPPRRRRYERLLAYMEEQIRIVAPHKW